MKQQILTDWFKEESGGKWSSKKLWGHVILLLVGIAFVLDGLNFYEADHHLFDAMLIAGTTLIGLNTLKGIWTSKKEDKK